MAYNKREHLQQNIDAIKLAFALDRQKRESTDSEWAILKKYSGFGGIKAVLNPVDKPEDIESWVQSERDLFPLVQELHAVLRENSKTEREYRNYVGSLKNSILTAFYTPPAVVEALSRSLYENGVRPDRILDPSAGTGNFSQAINLRSTQEVTNFEKDLLTGMILRHTRPKNIVRVEGFENIEERYSGHFDLAASNIPFGDVAVFDPYFNKHDDPVRHAATRTIHNYFFVKTFDMLREGGVMAFITSQGVMDSERNRSVREWLMDRCELVSAIRLPNNMFTDEAGTEVGSDLIVLQKHFANTGQAMTKQKMDFIESSPNAGGIRINNTFQSYDRVIQTDAKIDTNPYGQPAMVFTHSGGVDGIAEDLHEMLRGDIAKHLNFEIYNKYAIRKLQRTMAKPYYLFEEEVSARIPKPLPVVEPQTQIDQEFIPTEKDWQSVGEAMMNSQRRIWEQHPPQPEDYPQINQEHDEPPGAYFADYTEYYRGDWRERLAEQSFANQHERYQEPRRAGEILSAIYPDSPVFRNEELKENQEKEWSTNARFRQGQVPIEAIKTQESPQSSLQVALELPLTSILQQAPEPTLTPDTPIQPQLLHQEPLMTLYDLFGFTESERLQIRKPRGRLKDQPNRHQGNKIYSATLQLPILPRNEMNVRNRKS